MRLLPFLCVLFLCVGVQLEAAVSHADYFRAALAQQDVKRAESYGRKACTEAIRQKHYLDASVYYLELGKLFYERGNYTPAIAQGRAGLGVMQQFRIRNDSLTFHHFSLLAALYARLPMSDSATYWFTRSNDWIRQQPNVAKDIPGDVCGLYMNQGLFYGLMGDFHRSNRYLEEALALSRAIRNQRLESLVYNFLGNNFFKRRDFKTADTYYRKALAGYAANSVDLCWGQIILGNNLRAGGKPREGIEYVLSAQGTYARIKQKDPTSYDLDFEIQSANYLGECYRAIGNFGPAETAYKTCIDLHSRAGRTQGEFIAFGWIGLARMEQQKGNLGLALHFADKAVGASGQTAAGKQNGPFSTVVSERTLYEALLLTAEVKKAQWIKSKSVIDLAGAVSAYEETLHAAARLRRNMIPEESKHFQVEQVAKATNTAVDLCYELSVRTKSERWKNLLFDMIEQNRSMVMGDLLHEKNRAVQEVPSRVLVRERALRQRGSELRKLLITTRGKAKADSLRRLLNKVNILSYEFLDSLEREFGKYYALKYDFREFGLANVAGHLDRGTAYMSYFINDRFIYCVVADRGGSNVKRVRIPKDFPVLVKQLRQNLESDPVMFAFTAHWQSGRLHDLLISPFIHEKDYDRLIIARDGLLHYLPFEVLEPPGRADEFLGRSMAISYSYSARMTLEGAERFTTAPRVVGFAPFSGDNVSDSMKLITSLSEVKTWQGNFLTDTSASKRMLKKVIGEADVLLLATHAFADVAQPENSFVAFHPGEPDSLLYATEIVNMSLDKLRLVVLSACEGNDGTFNKAEGLLSLARAFRIAGCQTILTTSWKAQSESISEFSKLFRGYLAQGLPADIALLKTRQQFFSDPDLLKWGHPYYWANFTLVGKSAVIYPAPADTEWVVYGFVVVAVSLVFVWIIRKLRAAARPLQPF